MAKLETRYYKAHKNIYKDASENYKDREIRVEMGIPEAGINEETGILVICQGYGGHIDSNVFKKMRKNLSDDYNLITIQCDYFGNRFMKTEMPKELDDFIKSPDVLEGNITYVRKGEETENEFNDMGIMQALDVVSMTLNVIYELGQSGHVFNAKKIIVFGTSHGGYLAHLANVICPGLFACILDISAYLKPYYMEERRIPILKKAVKAVVVYKSFLNTNPQYHYKEELYDLRYLYSWIRNNCKIIAFQGAEDQMVKAEEKQSFINEIRNAEMFLVNKEDVDGILCRNAGHSLGIDFFELFKMIMPMLERILRQKGNNICIEKEVVLGNDTAQIRLSYEDGMPEVVNITF